MKIAIGSDHNGFELKEFIKKNFVFNKDIKFIDIGANNNTKTDYPIYTLPVCLEVLQGSADLGILISDTGVGMSIAANRLSQIYAIVGFNEQIAKLSRKQNNSNILILPANFITQEESLKIINSWLSAEFNQENKAILSMIDVITEDPIKISCCG